MNEHIPVLAHEVVSFFKDSKIESFVDGTLGAGGHANLLLQEHPEIIEYIGLDRDPNALEIAKNNLKKWIPKVRFYHSKFSNVKPILEKLSFETVDGILLDIGFSSMQIESKDRGFSFQIDSPLDMRMDTTQEFSAYDLVNKFKENELTSIFENYGEEKKARKIAKTLIQARSKKPIQTTFELKKIIETVLHRKGKIHPATKIFQAIRIFVNDEINELIKSLDVAMDILKKEKRLGVISFHSLEDREVKNVFKRWHKEGKAKILTKKPLSAKFLEKIQNPRARSAKLRFMEKK